jgi:tetratricopeptide (TPR) repeat protein
VTVNQATRWLLVVLGAALLGCTSFVAVTAAPGSCVREDVSFLLTLALHGHAPVLADEYLDHLCDWGGTLLGPGERRRMGQDTSHYEIGRAWTKLGEPERAIAAFRRDLEGATTISARVTDLLEIAKLLSVAGKHEAALRELDAADEELDGARWRWVDDVRVEVLVAADRRREAIALLEARPSSALEFDNAVTQMRLAELWLEEGELLRARAAYETALAICEEHYRHHEATDARVGLVKVLLAEHRLEQALIAIDSLLRDLEKKRIEIHHVDVWRLRAEIQDELGDPCGAAASIRRAYELEQQRASSTTSAPPSRDRLQRTTDRTNVGVSSSKGITMKLKTHVRGGQTPKTDFGSIVGNG